MIKITDEYIEKLDEGEVFDDELFKTEQEYEVRIPFTGYYPIKIKCKDPQVAMAYTIGAVRYVGFDMINVNPVFDEIIEENTYIENNESND